MMACPCCRSNCEKCSWARFQQPASCQIGCMPCFLTVSLSITFPLRKVGGGGSYYTLPSVTFSGAATLSRTNSQADAQNGCGYVYSQTANDAGSLSSSGPYDRVRVLLDNPGYNAMFFSVVFFGCLKYGLNGGTGSFANPYVGAYVSATQSSCVAVPGEAAVWNAGDTALGDMATAEDAENQFCWRSGSGSPYPNLATPSESVTGSISIIDAYC